MSCLLPWLYPCCFCTVQFNQMLGISYSTNCTCWFSGSFHSVGSIDGNFESVRLRYAGSGDQPIPKGHTFFLTLEEILQAQREVERCRKSAKPDATATEEEAIAPGLSLPNYIYDRC